MSFSYSGNPSASTLDEVRFYIGDTDSADPQLSDEEIAYLVTSVGSDALRVAIEACDRLVAKFTRKINTSSNLGQTSAWSALAEQYRSLRRDLENNLVIGPWVGGVSVADVKARREDTDAPKPEFALGMHNNPDSDEDSDDEDITA